MAETARWAGQLRGLLEKDPDPEHSRYWPLLWAAEFRAAPAAEYEANRKRAAIDVERLESFPEAGNRTLLAALAEGYKLTGQGEAAHKIEERLYPDAGVLQASQEWEKKKGLRTARLTEEEYQVIWREQARVSAEWVAKWPASPFAWLIRSSSLAFSPGWTKEEMEKAGEETLKADAANPMGWNYLPRKLRVAQTWLRYGIRPGDCIRMGEESLDQISQGPEEPNDLSAPPNAAEIAAVRMYGFDTSLWDAMSVIVRLSCMTSRRPIAC